RGDKQRMNTFVAPHECVAFTIASPIVSHSCGSYHEQNSSPWVKRSQPACRRHGWYKGRYGSIQVGVWGRRPEGTRPPRDHIGREWPRGGWPARRAELRSHAGGSEDAGDGRHASGRGRRLARSGDHRADRPWIARDGARGAAPGCLRLPAQDHRAGPGDRARQSRAGRTRSAAATAHAARSGRRGCTRATWRACRRRRGPGGTGERTITVGALHLDIWRQEAALAGRTLPLPPTEFRVLLCLAERAGTMLPYAHLVRCAQGYDADELEAGELIKPHIHHLRQKLEPDPTAPRYILNVRGKGYLLSSVGE